MFALWGAEFMNAVFTSAAGSEYPLFHPMFSPADLQFTPSADMIGQT
jgi:hypothetical protein